MKRNQSDHQHGKAAASSGGDAAAGASAAPAGLDSAASADSADAAEIIFQPESGMPRPEPNQGDRTVDDDD
jgi:hypothetical protein